jgi:uncharacterized membrane protein YedE/YeeE
MFVGFLAASAAAGLVAVPIVWTGTLGATLAPSTSINFLLLIGAIAFGLGALINDTCLLGSLARLGDGEMRLLALPLGLTIGILAADHGRFGYDSTWPSLISKPSATGLVTLLAFLVVLVLALVFVSTKSVLRTKPEYDQMKEDKKKFLRKLRAEYRKQGKEFKFVHIFEIIPLFAAESGEPRIGI